MPGAVWLLRVSAGGAGGSKGSRGGGAVGSGGQGGERASVERARWVQAGGASTTRAITLVGLGSICAGIDPAQEIVEQAHLFQAQNPFTI